jgi:NADH pyrophosphatase NudC (nudix superfamily)
MKPNQAPDELIDIVDEYDQVIKTIWRSQSRGEKHHRIVLAFLRYSDGSMCFLRRTADKEVFPSCLAVVGGCVQSGESYEEAFKREVMEEVSIDVTQHEYRLLGVVHPSEVIPGYIFKAVFEVIISDLNIPFNPDDFSEYTWVQPHEFVHTLAKTDKIAPDLPFLLNRFYQVDLE